MVYRRSSTHAIISIAVPTIVTVSAVDCIRNIRPSRRRPAIGFCTTGNDPTPSAPKAISTAPTPPKVAILRTVRFSAAFRSGCCCSSVCSRVTAPCAAVGDGGPSGLVRQRKSANVRTGAGT
ncbi:hypothetical protein MTP03_28290 [Tsukamurella sp. PLM1]|nr:hypothetical protein MTP03_28290 [Tsukamurella sp. PLM1]